MSVIGDLHGLLLRHLNAVDVGCMKTRTKLSWKQLTASLKVLAACGQHTLLGF